MNTTLETALNQYGNFWPIPALMITIGVCLLTVSVIGLYMDKKENPTKFVVALSMLTLCAGLIAFSGGCLIYNGRTTYRKMVKTILSSPAWEIRDARVATDKTIKSFVLSTIPEKEKVEIMGKTVTAEGPTTSMFVSGELMQILLQNFRMAQAVQTEATMAQSSH